MTSKRILGQRGFLGMAGRRISGGMATGALVLAIILSCAAAVPARAAEEDAATAALRVELAALPHKIVFERYDTTNWELYVMNADGTDPRNLTQTPDIHEMYPQASPDGTRICFEADVEKDGDTLRSVYYMNADGTGRTLVAEKSRQPCWSPDGTKIAFVRQEFPKLNITDYVSKGLCFYDLKTGETTEHPNKEICHLYNPTWSADGRWIVSTVHAGMGFGHGIIAIEVGGMGVYDLKLSGCRPCLSADGRQICWGADDHTISIADIDLSGGAPKVSNKKIVSRAEVLHQYHPDFSPEGNYVSYSVGPGGRTQAKGPGTHTEVAEMVSVAGKWNLFVKRSNGEGPAVQLTWDEDLSNKESEWLPVASSTEAKP